MNVFLVQEVADIKMNRVGCSKTPSGRFFCFIHSLEVLGLEVAKLIKGVMFPHTFGEFKSLFLETHTDARTQKGSSIICITYTQIKHIFIIYSAFGSHRERQRIVHQSPG